MHASVCVCVCACVRVCACMHVRAHACIVVIDSISGLVALQDALGGDIKNKHPNTVLCRCYLPLNGTHNLRVVASICREERTVRECCELTYCTPRKRLANTWSRWHFEERSVSLLEGSMECGETTERYTY